MNKQEATELMSSLIEVLPTSASGIRALDPFYSRAQMVIRQVFEEPSHYLTELGTAYMNYQTAYASGRVDPPLKKRALEQASQLCDTMMREVQVSKAYSDQSFEAGDDAPPRALIMTEPAVFPPQADSRMVFVVHGRNNEARNAMFEFLRSLGLHPIEWAEAVSKAPGASPYIGDILDAAFKQAQAIVVLLSGDDEARLREPLRIAGDAIYEKELTPQARPNVLFEAGLAFGTHPDRVVLVELGELRPFSDIGGRHTVRITNATESRQDLAMRLRKAGCDVNLDGTDWHTTGDFEDLS